jgi:hypothetical protein
LANPLGVSLPAIPGLPDLGVAPSASAYAVVDRPVATGSSVDRAAEELANGLAEHVGSSFAEAEGYALGHPDLQAGAQVEIAGVPKAFAGKWTISNARHIFDESEGGYRTRFFVSGRQERSLLGLASMGATQGEATRIPGLVCGIVTNNNDPEVARPGQGGAAVAVARVRVGQGAGGAVRGRAEVRGDVHARGRRRGAHRVRVRRPAPAVRPGWTDSTPTPSSTWAGTL